MVYLCGRMIGDGYSMLGRETALDPVSWTADGWPIVNGLKGPSVLQKRPKLQERNGGMIRKSDTTLLDWVTPRAPQKDGIFYGDDGSYRIKGSRYPLSKVEARNILLRRQTSFQFMAEAILEIPALQKGQEAGITCYYDENTWVCFALGREDGYYVQVKEHIGTQDICHDRVALPEEAQMLVGRKLHLKVDTDYLRRSFSYYIEDTYIEDTGMEDNDAEDKQKEAVGIRAAELTNVYYLCDEGIRMGKRFTGAMVGMYAYAGEEELYVKFERFTYQEVK